MENSILSRPQSQGSPIQETLAQLCRTPVQNRTSGLTQSKNTNPLSSIELCQNSGGLNQLSAVRSRVTNSTRTLTDRSRQHADSIKGLIDDPYTTRATRHAEPGPHPPRNPKPRPSRHRFMTKDIALRRKTESPARNPRNSPEDDMKQHPR